MDFYAKAPEFRRADTEEEWIADDITAGAPCVGIEANEFSKQRERILFVIVWVTPTASIADASTLAKVICNR